jgi:small subunit ribosomal protein S21
MKDNKLTGSIVFVKENENINQALRKFKKKIDDSGLLETLREKESYIKPSVRRKKAKSSAKARWAKKLREQQLPPKLF